MSTCTITPVSAFQSTNLNNKICSFTDLSTRVQRTLGAPLISLEVHQDQMFEFIAIAAEFFTKFAGYTREYLVFDSNLYTINKGIRLDHLYTLANKNLTLENKIEHKSRTPEASYYWTRPDSVYVAVSAIDSSYFTSMSGLSSVLGDGILANQIFNKATYNEVMSYNSSLSSQFIIKDDDCDTRGGSTITAGASAQWNRMFDYDLMEYRKVIDVTAFDEGSSTGINTLFTIEQTMAQQTYFSYAMGNYGFDLVSWYILKEWLETREKLLAMKRDVKFDPYTQILQFYPEPKNTRFYGVISCYVEKTVKEVIKEYWVYQYVLALTKIAIGHVRGKYANMQLFGGGSVNGADLLSDGLKEKERLELMMLEGSTTGYGDSDPPLFFVG
jgi:hypothetical protein